MAAATITGAQADAMKTAAGNKAAGPMMAFAGMNMAANAGGINAGQLFEMGQQNRQNNAAPQTGTGTASQAGAGTVSYTHLDVYKRQGILYGCGYG